MIKIRYFLICLTSTCQAFIFIRSISPVKDNIPTNLLNNLPQMKMKNIRWGSSMLQSSSSHHSFPSDAPITAKNNNSQNQKNDVKTADVLSLDSIRSTLIRQEETIIFALIERAQFRRNDIVYQSGGFGDLGLPLGSTPPATATFTKNHPNIVPLSFLEYILIGTEVLHCGVRRYTSPEEHAFFPERLPRGPLAALPQLDYPQLLSSVNEASSINFNPILLQKYKDWIVPLITQPGDDEQHGSTILADIAVLQALSRRVHYGKFVAESKYRSDPEGYQKLLDADDADGVMAQLTNVAVEEKVLKRARLKAATYGREPTSFEGDSSISSSNPILMTTGGHESYNSHSVTASQTINEKNPNHPHGGKVDPVVIERIYRDFIIPLTKDIEVAYLFKRCGKTPPVEFAPHRMSKDFTLQNDV